MSDFDDFKVGDWVWVDPNGDGDPEVGVVVARIKESREILAKIFDVTGPNHRVDYVEPRRLTKITTRKKKNREGMKIKVRIPGTPELVVDLPKEASLAIIEGGQKVWESSSLE